MDSGDYAFQNAEVNLLWQAIGLAVCIGAGLATGWIMSAILERTTGLGVSEDVQVAGYDDREWEIVHDLEPVPAGAALGEESPPGVRASDGEPTPTDVRTSPPGR